MAVSVFSAERSADRAFSQINVTPLVDVMLVLLIIFMVTMPLLNQRLDLNLPSPSPDAKLLPRERLVVHAGGDYLLAGQSLDRAGLAQALRELATRAPNSVLEIETAGEADYQAFAAALSTARQSGLGNISMVETSASG